MGGWEAESNAASLLNSAVSRTELHYEMIEEPGRHQKVKGLLAPGLFGNRTSCFWMIPAYPGWTPSPGWREFLAN